MQQTAEPFAEPWRTTALRTGLLALAAGIGVGLIKGHLALVPWVTLFALWFTLGGHFLELLFRNRLRHYISDQPAALALARAAYWFVGGVVLFEAAQATQTLLARRMAVPLSWWMAGVGFVGVELLIHLGLRARGEPSVYDGRG
jgi:hypothetical protein